MESTSIFHFLSSSSIGDFLSSPFNLDVFPSSFHPIHPNYVIRHKLNENNSDNNNNKKNNGTFFPSIIR